jgi:hypothetical protein
MSDSTLHQICSASTNFGKGVAIVPADTERLAVSGLVYLPITDLDGPEMVVLTRVDETLGTVVAFLSQLAERP